MMMIRYASVVFAGMALLAACGGSRIPYSPPETPPSDDTRVYDTGFDRAWTAVVQEFYDRDIPIKTIEKSSGVLESDHLIGEVGKTCDCGTYYGIPVGGYGRYGGDALYRYRVLVQERDEDRTTVILRSSCEGRHSGIEGGLTCRLDPKYERELREGIERRL